MKTHKREKLLGTLTYIFDNLTYLSTNAFHESLNRAHDTKEGDLFSLLLDKNKGFLNFVLLRIFKLTREKHGFELHKGKFFKNKYSHHPFKFLGFTSAASTNHLSKTVFLNFQL